MVHLHLPIAENRVNQFAARFEQLSGGDYAWFPSDWEPGRPVTAAEHADLIAEHEAIIARTQRLLRYWWPLAIVLVIALVFAMRGQVSEWWGTAVFVLPLPWVLWQWRRAERLPYVLTVGRSEAAPARGLPGGITARLRALPLSVPILLVALGIGLLVQLWRGGEMVKHPWMLAEGGWVAIFGLVILAVKAAGR